MRSEIGHRQRVKERFNAEGLDAFDEVHALELLLFYPIARRDTKPIARALLDRFGSIHKVLEATPAALQKVPGVGKGTATYIKVLNDLIRYYESSKDNKPVILNTLEDCAAYLKALFAGKRDEAFWVLCLDAKLKLLSCRKLAEGGADSVGVSLRSVVEAALEVNASSVILAHNHPGNYATPSDADYAVTARIFKALKSMDIALVDHMIFSDDDYISMLDTQRAKYIFGVEK